MRRAASQGCGRLRERGRWSGPTLDDPITDRHVGGGCRRAAPISGEDRRRTRRDVLPRLAQAIDAKPFATKYWPVGAADVGAFGGELPARTRGPSCSYPDATSILTHGVGRAPKQRSQNELTGCPRHSRRIYVSPRMSRRITASAMCRRAYASRRLLRLPLRHRTERAGGRPRTAARGAHRWPPETHLGPAGIEATRRRLEDSGIDPRRAPRSSPAGAAEVGVGAQPA